MSFASPVQRAVICASFLLCTALGLCDGPVLIVTGNGLYISSPSYSAEPACGQVFADTELGSISQLTFALSTEEGHQALDITTVSLTGDNSAEFFIKTAALDVQTTSPGNLVVAFAPISAGYKWCQVNIDFNSDYHYRFWITGNAYESGQLPDVPDLRVARLAPLTWSPYNSYESQATATLRIRNFGNAPAVAGDLRIVYPGYYWASSGYWWPFKSMPAAHDGTESFQDVTIPLFGAPGSILEIIVYPSYDPLSPPVSGELDSDWTNNVLAIPVAYSGMQPPDSYIELTTSCTAQFQERANSEMAKSGLRLGFNIDRSLLQAEGKQRLALECQVGGRRFPIHHLYFGHYDRGSEVSLWNYPGEVFPYIITKVFEAKGTDALIVRALAGDGYLWDPIGLNQAPAVRSYPELYTLPDGAYTTNLDVTTTVTLDANVSKRWVAHETIPVRGVISRRGSAEKPNTRASVQSIRY